MDSIKGSPSSDLRSLVARTAIDRMEHAYQDSARFELKRRSVLTDLGLFAHLIEAAKFHLSRYETTRDANYLRWAGQLQKEAEALNKQVKVGN